MENNKKVNLKITSLPIVSIVIATYNSAFILDRTLCALRKQDYPKDKMEIIIVDGGSKDNTIEIAKRFDCIIFGNPQTDPVNAKVIGYKHAKGKYIVTIDHDEILINPTSISKKIKAFTENPNCKAIWCTGYQKPENYPGLNQYISEFGDPFSCFVYRFSKDWHYFSKAMSHRALLVEEKENYLKYRFYSTNPNVILEICCGGVMFDRDYFDNISDFTENPKQMVHMFYIMLLHGEDELIIIKNDPLVHFSADSISAYLPKLRWRIVNNIHYKDRADQGFKGRTNLVASVASKKQYLFPLYVFSVFCPLFDSIAMSIKRKNISYMWHFLLSFYICGYIIYQYMLKIVGVKAALKTYDGKKVIYSEHRNEKDSI